MLTYPVLGSRCVTVTENSENKCVFNRPSLGLFSSAVALPARAERTFIFVRLNARGHAMKVEQIFHMIKSRVRGDCDGKWPLSVCV